MQWNVPQACHAELPYIMHACIIFSKLQVSCQWSKCRTKINEANIIIVDQNLLAY